MGKANSSGKNDDAPVILHALQEAIAFEIGVALMGIPDIGALAEERVGLLEEQEGPLLSRRIEQSPDILLCLAHVAAAHAAQIGVVEDQSGFVGQDLSRHGLARAAGPGEERADGTASLDRAGRNRRLLRLGAPLQGDLVENA